MERAEVEPMEAVAAAVGEAAAARGGVVRPGWRRHSPCTRLW